ncbi:MAG: hypothetical protein IT182_18440 [Acidobacteria bacterium]|nr:hypothetical protein [Acidobacteriota bacterium]
MRPVRPFLFSLVLASVVLTVVGCGKKGPPLAPLRPVPAAVSDLTATRLGDVVQLRFTLPAVNADGSTPANLARVDVYAVTGRPEGPLGRPLTPKEISTLLTRVGSIEVQPPPIVVEGDEAENAPPPPTPAPADGRPVQGTVVFVEETLTDALRAERFAHPDAAKIAKLRAEVGDDVDEAPVPSTEGSGRTLLWPMPDTSAARHYIALPYSTRGVPGTQSTALAVPLGPAPPAPPAPSVTHDATAFTIAWTIPPGLQRPIQATVTAASYGAAMAAKDMDARLPARPIVTYGPAHTFRVYEVPPPGTAGGPPPTPISVEPIEDTTFVDARMVFGVPRCYAVRSVEQRGAIAIESPLSAPTCVTAADTYPPPAPTGLVAVGSGGGVSLIWEPVMAPDLAGYLVLRGVEGEALRPITESPIVEATYRDATAQPGVIYTYAVVAVDRATPANASPESNRVRESAR